MQASRVHRSIDDRESPINTLQMSTRELWHNSVAASLIVAKVEVWSEFNKAGSTAGSRALISSSKFTPLVTSTDSGGSTEFKWSDLSVFMTDLVSLIDSSELQVRAKRTDMV